MPTLSQKYRPTVFAEITGQAHVTDTLKKEIQTQTLGHAYLFSGPRGIGKTTTARVFAKALNCEELKDGEPCNACPSCVSANEGRSLDIIEMDAATHTGVETVRESIIEHVRFSPVVGRRKIYILDEAHMFSSGSWNALLKTLEEPPAYAFFILATTEWHKVPATIVSRCQRFEFKRVSPEVMTTRLKTLASQEGWTVAPEVLSLIVSRADGFVRDAETLLGQLSSLGVSTITEDVARLVIPPSHVPLAADLLSLWAKRDHAGGLAEAERLFDEGVPLLPLFDDLLLIVRRLLSVSGNFDMAKSWKNGGEEERAMAPLVSHFSPVELSDLALLLLERRRDVKAGVDPLFALQLVGTVVASGLLPHSTSIPIIASASVTPIVLTPPPSNPPPIKSEPAPVNLEPVYTPVPESIPIPPPSVSPPASFDADVPGFDLNAVRAQWPKILQIVESKNPSLLFILKLSRPESVHGSVLSLRFQYSFHQDKLLGDPQCRAFLEGVIREATACPSCRLEGVVGNGSGEVGEQRQDLASHVLNTFGGTVVGS